MAHQIIGFAKQFFTLWTVSEPYTVHTGQFTSYQKIDTSYIQNLSKDLETAKSKVDGDFEINLELRGTKNFSTCGEIIDETPESKFKFGKYRWTDVDECVDFEYMVWYYNETSNKCVERALIAAGYKKHKGAIVSAEAYKAQKSEAKKARHIEKLERGHHFANGEKVEISIKKIGGFCFDGTYGTTFVETYESNDGKLFKYMGSSPADISHQKFITIKATIKNSNYKGIDETLLQRIKII